MRTIRPQIRPDGVPLCSGIDCPAYRFSAVHGVGGRCEITDERSPTYCGPKVKEMAQRIQQIELEEARERAKETTR